MFKPFIAACIASVAFAKSVQLASALANSTAIAGAPGNDQMSGRKKRDTTNMAKKVQEKLASHKDSYPLMLA